MLKSYFTLVTRNLLSLAGTAIATVAALLFVTLFGMQLAGFEGGPYLGIMTYLIIPMFFVLGLVLIPLGIWWHRRQERRAAARGDSPKPERRRGIGEQLARVTPCERHYRRGGARSGGQHCCRGERRHERTLHGLGVHQTSLLCDGSQTAGLVREQQGRLTRPHREATEHHRYQSLTLW